MRLQSHSEAVKRQARLSNKLIWRKVNGLILRIIQALGRINFLNGDRVLFRQDTKKVHKVPTSQVIV